MIEEIGNVQLILDDYSGFDHYSDGDIENDLLNIVRFEKDYDAAIERDGRWPVFYHLSKRRETIIQPMDIKKSDAVLEIGAGCGAVTGALADKAGNVDCVELSKRRSLINAYRNKGCSNLRIIVGNFEDINFKQRYDVITIVGVLEYAGGFINSKDPYLEFVRRTKKLITPGGRLYIAIENRFGLKYFSGCEEDHTSLEFEGIEGYGRTEKVKTFSKAEITGILVNSGFDEINFFYPFPDYKFPNRVFSDHYLPKPNELNEPGANYGRPRHVYFNEAKAFASMTSEDFKQFSNSFLVEAKMGEKK